MRREALNDKGFPVNASVQVDSATKSESGAPVGVFGEVSRLFASGRATVVHFLDLLSLEARRASLSLLWMLISGIVAAVCLVSAWLGILAALVIAAVGAGLPLLAAVVLAAVLNGVAGIALIYLCRSKSRDLLFSATRRQLAGAPSAMPDSP